MKLPGNRRCLLVCSGGERRTLDDRGKLFNRFFVAIGSPCHIDIEKGAGICLQGIIQGGVCGIFVVGFQQVGGLSLIHI